MGMWAPCALFFHFWGLISALVVVVEGSSFEYCVVGAGPGGLQIGHFLQRQNLSFMIFEKNSTVGSFFQHYPRGRELISVNKRHTGPTSSHSSSSSSSVDSNVKNSRAPISEFHLRHDWNSLLGNEDITPMTAKSKKRLPNADILLSYLHDFAQEQIKAGRIRFNSTVKRISRLFRNLSPPLPSKNLTQVLFELQILFSDENTNNAAHEIVTCERVIIATGIGKPRVPRDILGIQHAEGYDSTPTSGERFENKSIAILGGGNGAFEIAKMVEDYSQFTHLYALRRNNLDFRLSLETHYTGSSRANRIDLWDGYLLKSLDLVSDRGIRSRNLAILPCVGLTMKCLFKTYRHRGRLVLQIGEASESDLMKIFEIWKGKFPSVPELSSPMWITSNVDNFVYSLTGSSLTSPGVDAETRNIEFSNYFEETMIGLGVFYDTIGSITLNGTTPQEPATEFVDALLQLRLALGNNDFTHPYHHVFYALGWEHGLSIYHESARPNLLHNRRLPRLNSRFESVNVPGMYFVGTLMHGRDLKRSAGGFIHGFRHCTQLLSRIFEVEHRGLPWSKITARFALPQQLGDLARKLQARMDQAASPYIMFYTLGDAAVFQEDGSALYLEDISITYLTERYHRFPRLFWTFGWGFGQKRSLRDQLTDGTGFQPWIYFWEGTSGDAGLLSRWLTIVKDSPDHSESVHRSIFVLNESYNTNWSFFPFLKGIAHWLCNQLVSFLPEIAVSCTSEEILGEPHSHLSRSSSPFVSIRDTPKFISSVLEIDIKFSNSLNSSYHVGILGPRHPITDSFWTTLGSLEATEVMQTFDGDVWAVFVALHSEAELLAQAVFNYVFKVESGIYQEVEITDSVLASGLWDKPFPYETSSHNEPDIQDSSCSLDDNKAPFHKQLFAARAGQSLLSLFGVETPSFDEFDSSKSFCLSVTITSQSPTAVYSCSRVHSLQMDVMAGDSTPNLNFDSLKVVDHDLLISLRNGGSAYFVHFPQLIHVGGTLRILGSPDLTTRFGSILFPHLEYIGKDFTIGNRLSDQGFEMPNLSSHKTLNECKVDLIAVSQESRRPLVIGGTLRIVGSSTTPLVIRHFMLGSVNSIGSEAVDDWGICISGHIGLHTFQMNSRGAKERLVISNGVFVDLVGESAGIFQFQVRGLLFISGLTRPIKFKHINDNDDDDGRLSVDFKQIAVQISARSNRQEVPLLPVLEFFPVAEKWNIDIQGQLSCVQIPVDRRSHPSSEDNTHGRPTEKFEVHSFFNFSEPHSKHGADPSFVTPLRFPCY